jgi:hypothetical protein
MIHIIYFNAALAFVASTTGRVDITVALAPFLLVCACIASKTAYDHPLFCCSQQVRSNSKIIPHVALCASPIFHSFLA